MDNGSHAGWPTQIRRPSAWGGQQAAWDLPILPPSSVAAVVAFSSGEELRRRSMARRHRPRLTPSPTGQVVVRNPSQIEASIRPPPAATFIRASDQQGQGTMADANVEDAGELRWTQCLILDGSRPGQMIFNDVLGRTIQDDEVFIHRMGIEGI